ncbi:MAG: DUF5666 domain-containing protein [Candidatus Omnitrophica bacterium]|nr:DUF5666 domain-containing protein [Candidatus Omnitrophota bacterium]MDD5238111.1 DUF5666 domain-containing protein [Candidatus Omnitrophota bacterium]
MCRIGIITLLIVFTVIGVCLADKIKGNVSSVDASKKTLQISGVTIKAADAWIENEQDYPLLLKDIALGDYIEVGGKFTGLSEIKARKIDRKMPECGVVNGKIASIDAKKREIIISGITVKVPVDAWLEGPGHVRIPLELFAPGYSVQCKGEWTGISELTAFKVVVD